MVEYTSRLFVTGASFALFIGLPVSWFGSVGAESEALKRILCAASSGVFAVILAVVRMYLGWAYVGNRLLSATVECIIIFFIHFCEDVWSSETNESKYIEESIAIFSHVLFVLQMRRRGGMMGRYILFFVHALALSWKN